MCLYRGKCFSNVPTSRDGYFQVLLLMASSIAATAEEAVAGAVSGKVPTTETRRRQQQIAEITEMIHVLETPPPPFSFVWIFGFLFLKGFFGESGCFRV